MASVCVLGVRKYIFQKTIGRLKRKKILITGTKNKKSLPAIAVRTFENTATTFLFCNYITFYPYGWLRRRLLLYRTF